MITSTSICYYTFWSGVAGFIFARRGRADKPQHHDKRWNKMFISVDWLFSLRQNRTRTYRKSLLLG